MSREPPRGTPLGSTKPEAPEPPVNAGGSELRRFVGTLRTPPGGSVEDSQRSIEWLAELGERYKTLRAELAEIQRGEGPSPIKSTLTVLALMKFLSPENAADGAAPTFAVQRLLDPMGTRLWIEFVRGNVAAAPAVLRAAGMNVPTIKLWLDKEIASRSLAFQSDDAMRWFYDCNEGLAQAGMINVFKAISTPSGPLTVEEAKALAAGCLDAAMQLNVAPLKRKPRRSR